MKEKELKKLSRLELLEILLEETKENESLRKELEAMHSARESSDLLMSLTENLNVTLKHAKELTARLDKGACEKESGQIIPPSPLVSSEQKKFAASKKNDKNAFVSDLKLYFRILKFYYENEEALKLLPENMQEEITTRIRGILNGEK